MVIELNEPPFNSYTVEFKKNQMAIKILFLSNLVLKKVNVLLNKCIFFNMLPEVVRTN